MRWQDRERSDNVEDRRGASPKGLAIGGGLGTLALLVLVYFLGGDPQAVLNQLQQNPPGVQQPGAVVNDAAEAERVEFVKVVLKDTETVWQELFRQQRRAYAEPKLVLFRDQVESACGMASAAVGPFYCPADSNVYLDLAFFEELQTRFHAPGEFAQSYVIAHEIGHHVQNLLGISETVHQKQKAASKPVANELSVRLELQADFFAGVWAHHAEKKWRILEPGDVEKALQAASAIGDDRLQLQGRGYVVPESFTHGSSAQRVRWFRRGLETGDMSQGNTFEVAQRDL